MRKTISIILSTFMLIGIVCGIGTAFEAKAEIAEFKGVPSEYVETEYERLVEFFEITDEAGITNGEKLNPEYNPNDPETWKKPDTWDIGIFWEYGDDGLNHCVTVCFNDLDMVGELNLNGFVSLSSIDIPNNRIVSVETEECYRCDRLDVSGNRDICFDTATLPYLTALYVSNCNLYELDLSPFVELGYLYCDGNNLSELDLSQQTQLWWLYCENNMLTELDLSNNTHIGPFNCSGNRLTELDLSNCTELWSIKCSDNEISTLILPESAGELNYIDISNNNFTEFNCENLTRLELLYCRNNMLTELVLPDNNIMTDIDCRNNQLTSIDVSAYPALEQLLCSGNPIDNIDLSSNHGLFVFDCPYMAEIELTSQGNMYQDELDNFPFEAHIYAENGGLIILELAAEVDEDSIFWPRPYINGRAIVRACAEEGYVFAGWYDADGNMVSIEAELVYTEANTVLNLTARFEQQEAPVEPTEAPVEPTEEPVEPTEEPVEPTEEPVGPDVPSTGMISIAGIGITAILTGVGAIILRKKEQ